MGRNPETGIDWNWKQLYFDEKLKNATLQREIDVLKEQVKSHSTINDIYRQSLLEGLPPPPGIYNII